MNRRESLKYLGTTLAAAPLTHFNPLEKFEHLTAEIDDSILLQLNKLKSEPACRCEIKMERGGARLFLNGKEEFPFFAVSS